MNHNIRSGVDNNIAKDSQALQAEKQVTIVTKIDVMRGMTEAEARQCVNSIKEHITSIRELLIELDERKGWVVLKHPSMAACLRKEFSHQSKTNLKYQLYAGRIEKSLGVPLNTYKESHLRPLRKLDPSFYQSALNRAYEIAGKRQVTAKHISQAVNNILSVQSESAKKGVRQIQNKPQHFLSKSSSQGEIFRLQYLLDDDIQYNGSFAIALDTENSSTLKCQVLNKELEIKQENIKRLDMDEEQLTRQREIIERVQRLAGCNLDPLAWSILETLNRQVEYSDYQLQILEMTERFYKIRNHAN